MRLYEAWFCKEKGGMMNRAIEIRANTIREAYQKAKELAEKDDTLRGVFEIDESSGKPI